MKALWLTLALPLALAACGAPDHPSTGDAGGSGAGASLQASLGRSDGTAQRLPLDVGGGVVIDGAVFKAGEIKLVGDATNDERTELRGVRLDLKAPVELTFANLPPGLYSRLHVELEGVPDDDDEGSPPLSGNGFAYEITGHLADGTPLSVHDGQSTGIDLRAGDGMELKPGGTLSVALALDASAWLSGITLPPAANGTVTIDASVAATLQAFRANVVRSASLQIR